MTLKENFLKGIIKENPVFVMLLGMCPTLGVTTSVENALGMGVATLAVLVMSNIVISLIRRFIPDEVRIPAYIVVIATLVTAVEILMMAYVPDLYDALGLFIPLIVVNCLILGRAEAFASKNGVFSSIIDALGMGIGFTLGLTVLGAVRELLGAGTLLGFEVLETIKSVLFDVSIFGIDLFKVDSLQPATIFILPPGAFFVLGVLLAFITKRQIKRQEKLAAAAKQE